MATMTPTARRTPRTSRPTTSRWLTPRLTVTATTVTVTARDANGNSATGSFIVTVRDTTAPVISVVDVVAEATSAAVARGNDRAAVVDRLRSLFDDPDKRVRGVGSTVLPQPASATATADQMPTRM